MQVLKKTAWMLCFASSAFTSFASADVTAQSGVFIQGNLGAGKKDLPNEDNFQQQVGAGSVNFTDSVNLVGGVGAGYQWAIDPHYLLGLEANYTDFGDTDYLIDYVYLFDVHTQALQLLASLTYVASNGIEVFAKGGYAYMHERYTGSLGPYQVGLGTRIAWEPVVAVGLGYMANEHLSLNLQYEHVFGAKLGSTQLSNLAIDKPVSEDAITLGVVYTLPL